MGEKKQKFPTRSSLVDDNIYLKPAIAENIANTYHWYLHSDPELLSCRPQPFQTASEAAQAYQQEIRTPEAQHFMIIRQKDKTPVGWIRFFNLNSLNRSAELDILIDPEEQRHGYALASIRLLCGYLFRSRGLNKVYAQVGSMNTAAVKLLEKAGFKKDGTLRHHYFYRGEFHDGLIYSLLLYEFER